MFVHYDNHLTLRNIIGELTLMCEPDVIISYTFLPVLGRGISVEFVVDPVVSTNESVVLVCNDVVIAALVENDVETDAVAIELEVDSANDRLNDAERAIVMFEPKIVPRYSELLYAVSGIGANKVEFVTDPVQLDVNELDVIV